MPLSLSNSKLYRPLLGGLSARALASKCKPPLTRSFVAAVLSGKRRFSIVTARSVALALGISVDALLVKLDVIKRVQKLELQGLRRQKKGRRRA